MDLKNRAELVREIRFEMKRLSHRPRYGRETPVDFVNRTSEGGDGGIQQRAQEWDAGRMRRTRRARRFIPTAPQDDYTGYWNPADPYRTHRGARRR